MKLGIVTSTIASLVIACATAQEQQAAPRPQPRAEVPLAVVARLSKGLNAKNLKVGDKVAAVVIQDLLLAGRVFIPREAKLTGRVVEVQAETRSDPRSRLALVFESKTLRDGEVLPMHGVIQALAPPLPDPFLEAAMASSSPYGASEYGHPVNGSISSSGQTNVPTQVTAQRPRASGATALEQRQRALENADKPGPAGSGPYGALTVSSHGVFGLPGLFLTSAAPVPAIVAAGRNVELQSGAQIVLRLDSSQ
jgi:hypothetical protein